jgi:L-seryl-tRNA(Ser) seleniumtransferase
MTPRQDSLRKIPSVDQVLAAPAVVDLLRTEPRPVVVRAIRACLDEIRTEVRGSKDNGRPVPGASDVAAQVARSVRLEVRGLRRVLNATGVVLHTNLGRARLADSAVRAVQEVASGACDLEFDLVTGKRSSRGRILERRLVEMTDAEGALVVNNNAGALVLALNELARGREVIVSRGELVEIGGSFRLPDVMERTGARLREVGTTNRTHVRDYENAIGPETAMLLKVHRSNFRQEGFVTEPTLAELVELGRRYDLTVLHDLGSGALWEMPPLRDEPLVPGSLASGVDLVTFSGDKLLGGPQAGILLGREPLIERLRKNPLARALRIDKFTIAALAATLDLLEDPDRAQTDVPVLRALGAEPAELAGRAEAMVRALDGCPALRARTTEALSEVGGGAVPAEGLPTTVVALSHETLSPDELAGELRAAEPPVIGRIAGGELLLDPRSLDRAEDEECVEAIRARLAGSAGGGR